APAGSCRTARRRTTTARRWPSRRSRSLPPARTPGAASRFTIRRNRGRRVDARSGRASHGRRHILGGGVRPPAPPVPSVPPAPAAPVGGGTMGGGGTADGTNDTSVSVKFATQGAVTPSVGTVRFHPMALSAVASRVASGEPLVRSLKLTVEVPTP